MTRQQTESGDVAFYEPDGSIKAASIGLPVHEDINQCAECGQTGGWHDAKCEAGARHAGF